MKRNRRRRGFDEERKRQLQNNLRNYFISSKHLTYGNQTNLGQNFGEQNFSEAAFGSADHQLDPQSQLEKAKEANYNFANIGITPESSRQNLESADQTSQDKQAEQTEQSSSSEKSPAEKSSLTSERDQGEKDKSTSKQ